MNFRFPPYFRTTQYNTIDKLNTSSRSITSHCERFFHDQSLCFNSFHNSQLYMTHTRIHIFPLSFQWIHEWSRSENLLQMIKSGILRGTYAYYTLIEREGEKNHNWLCNLIFFPLLSTHIKVSLSFFSLLRHNICIRGNISINEKH